MELKLKSSKLFIYRKKFDENIKISFQYQVWHLMNGIVLNYGPSAKSIKLNQNNYIFSTNQLKNNTPNKTIKTNFTSPKLYKPKIIIN